jgi:protein TonB
MTQRLPTTDKNDDRDGLNWPRIAGISIVIAVHAAALLLLLAPVAPPGAEKQDEDVTRVVIIEPPPLPPPPPPPPPEPPKPQEIKQLAPPQPSPIPPPPEEPPVVFDEPSPIDTQAPPPRPPAPPAAQPDIGASVDISSKNMNPPKYPPAAYREGIQGEVVLIVDVDANGNVTNVAVEKSSRNRDLDRAAMDAARKWRFNPSIKNGQKSAGRVRVPVAFRLQ